MLLGLNVDSQPSQTVFSQVAKKDFYLKDVIVHNTAFLLFCFISFSCGRATQIAILYFQASISIQGFPYFLHPPRSSFKVLINKVLFVDIKSGY